MKAGQRVWGMGRRSAATLAPWHAETRLDGETTRLGRAASNEGSVDITLAGCLHIRSGPYYLLLDQSRTTPAQGWGAPRQAGNGEL